MAESNQKKIVSLLIVYFIIVVIAYLFINKEAFTNVAPGPKPPSPGRNYMTMAEFLFAVSAATIGVVLFSSLLGLN